MVIGALAVLATPTMWANPTGLPFVPLPSRAARSSSNENARQRSSHNLSANWALLKEDVTDRRAKDGCK